MPFPDQLAHIQLSPSRGLGRPSIAQVGIVRPDHDLRLPIPLSAQVAAERVEGVDRVLIAQVPRDGPPTEHRPVVLRCVLDSLHVLLGIEQLVLGQQPISVRIVLRVTL
jgi:hypothetical protein